MVNKKMEGKGRSSLMLLFQKCSSFSSRYICKQDLMRRCHLDWNCQILPLVDTKWVDGAEILRLQPTTAAYVSPSLHQQSLPRAFWRGWVQPVSFPWMGSLGSASQLQTSVLFPCPALVQHFAQCLPCYLGAAAGVGLQLPELPRALGEAGC